eukprot:5078878-Prymnesium_polylepis.1
MPAPVAGLLPFGGVNFRWALVLVRGTDRALQHGGRLSARAENGCRGFERRGGAGGERCGAVGVAIELRVVIAALGVEDRRLRGRLSGIDS